ncbi:UNVERIFIED_CONTAM: hypothetical protein GTU68_007748, partial [Idotea baltica]|nr:hypothetical protein [Idotea baltica]
RWGGIFDPAALQTRLGEIEVQSNDPTFWSDQERAQKVQQERSQITTTLEQLSRLKSCLGDAEALLEMIAESEEAELVEELNSELSFAEGLLREAEMTRMLTGEHDSRNAILEINAGAGGTEAQDWAEMLLRMYLRWAEKKQFSVEILDQNQADEAGIKSATVLVSGQNAFGYLRSERGVHRLVRISPFDTNS